jgi:hypothetical protein
MQKTIALIALFGYTMAATGLKQRLAQTTVRGEGEMPPAGSGVPECSCDLPGEPVGHIIPDTLGAGILPSWTGSAVQTTAESIVSIPDTAFESECESACCACNAADHVSESSATRKRTYDINGSICVTETIEMTESGNGSEQSVGHSHKATACVTENSSGAGEMPPGVEVCLCTPDASTGLPH